MNDIIEEIQKLKKEKNAVILAHYYVDGAIQDIADYLGDSYYLSKIAVDCPQDVIVFAGVEFMGESAKLLSPNKTVLMPDKDADCPMAHMVDEYFIARLRKEYEDLCVVCYINSTAEIKTMSDVCVTSSNAKRIVEALPNKNILFIPDQNLGKHIAELVPSKNFLFCNGYCPTHYRITPEDILTAKEKHPQVKVLAHPECNKEVRDLCDYIGSTSGIIDFATKCEDEEFIICTEEGILYELEKNNPNKKFYFPERIVCPNMKKTNLQNVYDALCGKVEEVVLDEEIAKKALTSLENMHKLKEMVLCGE